MAGRLDNNRYTKEKNTSLKLSSGLTEAPKFVQSEEGQDLVNTPLALSMEKILVKGDLHVEGDITAGDKKIIGDITQITKGVGVDTKTTESGHYNILFTGGSGVNVGMTALTDTIAITGTDADTDNKGVVELATTAETTTGTDTDRAVTPDGLKDGFEGSTNITKVGALDTGGSITSGFGSIDVGSSTIDTTGDVSVGNLQVSGQDIAFDASDSGIEINPSAHHLVGKELLISSGSPTAGTTSNGIYLDNSNGGTDMQKQVLQVIDGDPTVSQVNEWLSYVVGEANLYDNEQKDKEYHGRKNTNKVQ